MNVNTNSALQAIGHTPRVRLNKVVPATIFNNARRKTMNGELLLYISSFLTAAWGVSHLFPTRAVVTGFGEISADNKRIITMEWITEGVALIFIGALISVVTYIDSSSPLSSAVYWTSFGALNALSVVSLFTGFKNSFIAFKLCPFIFSGSSILVAVGSSLT